MSSSLNPRPVIPAHEIGTAIVVFLVNLSHDEEHSVKSELEFPRRDSSPRSVEYVLWSRISEGTRADIFDLTLEASKKGHGNVIFVDSMSLKKKTVVLSHASDGHSKVEAGRLEAGAVLLTSATPETHRLSDIVITNTFEIVLDPSAPPFSENVVKADDTELETDLATLTSLPAKLELDPKRPMVVFTSIFSNADEQAVKTELESADTQVQKFIYYPWIGSKPASRADVFRVMRQWRMAHSRPYYWRMLFVDAQSLATNSVIAATFEYDGARQIEETAYFKRIPYKSVPGLWSEVFDSDMHTTSGDNLSFGKYVPESAASETIRDPQGPLYFRVPPYLPEDDFALAPPVFFLSKLSEQDEQTIKEELGTVSEVDCMHGQEDEVKKICYVPWTGEEDGTEADMFRIAKRVVNHRRGMLQIIIFVDRQSAEDKTAILTDLAWNWGTDPTMPKEEIGARKELIYGRTPLREASSAWINLDIANMSLEELIIEPEPRLIIDPDAVGEP